MLLFDKATTAGICLRTDAPAVRLAALDMQRDLRRLSGQAEGFPFSGAGQIQIRTVPGEPESYTVEVGEGENPLPIEQFHEIYRDNLGILVTAATG